MKKNGAYTKTIIFSKNRACQLELLLRSLTVPADVLYTHDPEFEKGYRKLIKMYPNVNFIRQTNFKSQLISYVKNSDYLFSPTDDDVMISPFKWNCPEFAEFKNNPKILSLSLALTPDIAGKKWRWQNYKGNHRLRMWAYPVSIDSCILRSEDVLDAIQSYGNIPTPNYFEMALLAKIPNRPYMMCFNTRKIINNTVNQVQKDFPAHTYGVPAEELERNFLAGKRLSLADIKKQTKDARIYRVKIPFKYEHP